VYVGTEERFVTVDNTHGVTLELGESTSIELPIIPARTKFFDETISSAMEFRERMQAPEGFS
ncbi:MAG TPA: hypothetical protein VI997_00105, partial [Candidatus Thermoplasmatota archaeon]|nr:hypothetical protein [Candidatus Thermoplasmatota archaeon]